MNYLIYIERNINNSYDIFSMNTESKNNALAKVLSIIV